MTKTRDLANLGSGFLQDGATGRRPVESKLRDVVSVTDFGADPTGGVDSLAAIQAAAAAHSELYFPKGTYLLSNTLNLRSKLIYGESASFSCNHAGIGLILGGNQASGDNPVQKVQSVTRVSGDYSITPAVRIIGAKHQQIWIKRCPYIQLYADTDFITDTSCAYSSFWFNWVYKLELTTNPSPAGNTVQWINENIFYLNRIEELRVAGTYPHNHNKFLYGSFEVGTINFEVGFDNRVEGVRGEDGCNVTFASGTANNVVLATWLSSGTNYRFPGIVTDNGSGNHVGHQRWIDNKLTPITAFTYDSLRQHPDGTYNTKGVSNVTIGASSLTVSSFAFFYDSGIIPCNNRSMTIHANLLNRVSGGYRSIIDGYDANKALIASTGTDVSVAGSGNHGFGQESFTSADGCTDELSASIFRDTKYIRIRFRASANGINAEGFALGLRYNNSDQRDPLWAQAVAGSFAAPVPKGPLAKQLSLQDNVQATLFTFAIPALTQSTENVSLGFEVSYVIRCSRDSSNRSWRATYGKVYGAISRGWEDNSFAAPVFSITTTDQALVTTDAAPTITWAASLDAGADNGAKNGYLAITVDNPIPAINHTAISATISWVVGGGNGANTNVGVS